jgi:phage shock protein E
MFEEIKTQIPEYINKGAVIVDVRTQDEYRQAHAEGTINIPLQELIVGAQQLDKNKITLLCCVSGNRSGIATKLLQSMGFREVINIGPWTNCLK